MRISTQNNEEPRFIDLYSYTRILHSTGEILELDNEPNWLNSITEKLDRKKDSILAKWSLIK